MDKNISKLLEYAEVTGVKNIVKRYLEVLVWVVSASIKEN
jgi:hypothetical protein